MPFNKFIRSLAISGLACFKLYGNKNTKIDVFMVDIECFKDLLRVSMVVYRALYDILN
jgi:hypothetical protein